MVFSLAQQVFAVCDSFGTEYRQPGTAFSQATFRLRSNGRWVRFEIVATDGAGLAESVGDGWARTAIREW